ncbi:MAG TPA: hypothetical protein VFN10_12015 [Thermoanaerobaculia bacterium]|nr:hypothetical protein [Thermoanaerobaculia bacterium]
MRYRRVSRELETLLRMVHDQLAPPDLAALQTALESLLTFLAGDGRTDANCNATYHFFTETEETWRALPEPYQAILDDMSGTLHETVYAPAIAKTFEATPEQLLERVRRLRRS